MLRCCSYLFLYSLCNGNIYNTSFTNSYFSSNVYISETGLLSERLIQSVLNSNLRIYSRHISSLVPFRFSKIGLYAAKKLFNWDSHQFKFLWLNSNVKYRRSTLYIEKFANAGINYHYQLVDDNNNYLSLGDLARKYDLKNENELFLKYVKLHLSVPEK